MDVYVSPTYITEKTTHTNFDLLAALTRIYIITYPDFADALAMSVYETTKPAWDKIMADDVDSAKKLLPASETDD